MNNLSKSVNLQLLVLSNGHGEDIIAIRVIQELLRLSCPPDVFALPIVGEGHAYQKLEIPLIGKVQKMPSGGFVYMDNRQLIRDVKGGLLKLTWQQIQAIRRWVNVQKRLGNNHAILAVGDIVPLLFAFISGANYAFIGTAKSEYYVQDENGLLPRKSKSARWENFSGSIYHPWERFLMSRRRCRAIFPRDTLTAKILTKWTIPAFDLGNPMMDGLEPSFNTTKFYHQKASEAEVIRPFIITLLPGSRSPEAYNNWEIILIAVSALLASFRLPNSIFQAAGTMVFLGAIAPGLDIENLAQTLQIQGWRPTNETPVQISDPGCLTFKQKNAYIILSQNAYNDCLHLGDIAIAMAGTATEQFIGLGKPAIAIPGQGPQYNPAFAEAQSRLLGASLILLDQPATVSQVVQSLLTNPDWLQIIAENGLKRMGKPGAAKRIAECLLQRLSH
ncbi:MAG TPA: lipid-A-disaccharide synthase-related protein [Nostocaceae cyanobacterium]|nr:lipid-A-disaccharide synthase-related protein [Nostocaceae cyanobacterium]